MKKRNNYLYNSIVICFFFSSVYSQEIEEYEPHFGLTKIALINQNDSYVTFPVSIGNLESLLFEANISPSFIIRKRKDSRLMAVLTSQIIIRMYNEDSYPVRTPSYIPQVSFYYLSGDKKSNNHITLFGKIAHHSNGQDGDFYDENRNINLQSGNFSTNYFELGLIHTTYNESLNAVRFFKSSVEIHPKNWVLKELQGQYSRFLWHNTFGAFKLPLTNSIKEDRPNFSLKLETSIMLDKYNDLNTFDLDRLNGSLTFYYHPKFLEDIGLFVQFYHGIDYYNIYFQHRLNVVRFGIMTEILRF